MGLDLCHTQGLWKSGFSSHESSLEEPSFSRRNPYGTVDTLAAGYWGDGRGVSGAMSRERPWSCIDLHVLDAASPHGPSCQADSSFRSTGMFENTEREKFPWFWDRVTVLNKCHVLFRNSLKDVRNLRAQEEKFETS